MRGRTRRWAVVRSAAPLQPLPAESVTPVGTQVLVEVSHCGLCHTDVHFWQEPPASGIPMTLGHEIVGRVVDVGPDARGVSVGDERLVYPWLGCGECGRCMVGDDNRCTASQALGVRRPGGFGTHVIVPHPRYLLDFSGIPAPLAATYACSGLTSYAAIGKLSRRAPDDPIVLIGAGGLGLNALSILRARGHRAIVVVESDEGRLRLAARSGATVVVDANGADVRERIVAAIGSPPAAILDFVNSADTAALAFSCLNKGGALIQVGLWGGNLSLPLSPMVVNAFTVAGSFVGSLAELRELVALAQSGALAPIPITVRPMCEVTESLRRLAAGDVQGRIVLAHDPAAVAVETIRPVAGGGR